LTIRTQPAKFTGMNDNVLPIRPVEKPSARATQRETAELLESKSYVVGENGRIYLKNSEADAARIEARWRAKARL
jgi:hypothetical protein